MIAFVLALTCLSAVQSGNVHAQPDPTEQADLTKKLTTVLADLAQAVPQERAPSIPQRSAPIQPLSVETLPKSVQDAMRGRKLRINSDNEVQVYVLMQGV